VRVWQGCAHVKQKIKESRMLLARNEHARELLSDESCDVFLICIFTQYKQIPSKNFLVGVNETRVFLFTHVFSSSIVALEALSAALLLSKASL
jgi:hypothetical protein